MRTDEIEAFSKVDLGGKESILTGTNIRTRVRWLIPISRQGSANWYQYQDRDSLFHLLKFKPQKILAVTTK
ncbi:hypothetical protein J6590_028093 [Homalodisca vitripennis]|nr:hypothetical protein J6590_028093 [Homalodisca vitripennis]